jgi:uncharacterized protein YceH (UPF0502 family)
MHTLCGDAIPAMPALAEPPRGAEAPAASWRTEMEEEIASLKEEVSELRAEIDSIKASLGL